jgi:hypothetical protein
MKHLLFLLVLPCALSAYAPLVPKARAVATLSFAQFDTSHFYDKEGDKLKSYNIFQRNLYSLMLEAGVSETDNISAWIAPTEIQDHLNGDEFDIADTEIAWKRGWLFWDDAIFSTELTAIIPVSQSYIPDIRYGRFGAQASVLYAQTFFPLGYKTTVDGSLGYRWYSGFPSDQVRASLAAWIDFSCRFQLLLETSGDIAIFNGKQPIDYSFFFYNANPRVWRGRAELNYYASDRLSFTLGYLYHFLGQNIAAGGEWIARMSYCF